MNASDSEVARPAWVHRLARSLNQVDGGIHRPTLDMLKATGRWTDGTPVQAAVLVPIMELPGGPELVLTRRRDDLAKHAGQVAFPGGAADPEDPGPEGTALREAEEEIALPPPRVSLLGRLARYPTVSGYLITPVVGYVGSSPNLTPAPGEVAEIFTLPLDVLLDHSRWQQRMVPLGDREVPFQELSWDGQRIWGVTAGMLQLLVPLLRSAREGS